MSGDWYPAPPGNDAHALGPHEDDVEDMSFSENVGVGGGMGSGDVEPGDPADMPRLLVEATNKDASVDGPWR